MKTVPPLTETQLAMIKFERYLTKNYPLTSAMSYHIGEYVWDRILKKNFSPDPAND